MDAELEIRSGDRFEFGANWARFLELVDEKRVRAAESSLQEMLAVSRLDGETFLDIGCGSGLFSLAARRLGARVHSFDFDPRSVACARELRRRYLSGDEGWQIEQGSVLDGSYLDRLGHFDIVYSWGVLHHTGAMWTALENAIGRTKRDTGRLLIAIYNDQGWKSHAWWFVKRIYNRLPGSLRRVLVGAVIGIVKCVAIVKRATRPGPTKVVAMERAEMHVRGMSVKYDWVDWIGGFPYEFASLATLESYVRARGFSLTRVKPTVGWGCNELLARRLPCAE